MAKLFTNKRTTLSLLENPVYPREYRKYLGMSELGHSCSRYLWYSFRWAFSEEIPARMMRLFDRGHREEEAIIKQLTNIGYTVFDQQREFVAFHGHVMGHWDGGVKGVIEAPKTPHVLELKTMKEQEFKKLIKSNVQSAKPIYYAQSQLYMHFSQYTRTLFIAVNKNNDAYYVERIRYNKDHALNLISRGERVVLEEEPPPRQFKPTWYECKFCSAQDICHFGKAMRINCRTCRHVGPALDAKWDCDIHGEDISRDVMREGCADYQAIDNES